MPLTNIRADHNMSSQEENGRSVQPDEMRSEMLPPKDRQTVTERQSRQK